MADRVAEHREVEAVNAAFYEAFETADLDTMQDLWLEDDETLCVHPGAMPIRGTGPINRSWALIMANTPYIQFFLTDVEVEVVGEIAVVTCAENILTGMGESALAGGRAVATNVFRHTASGWRLWIHHASPVITPAEGDDSS